MEKWCVYVDDGGGIRGERRVGERRGNETDPAPASLWLDAIGPLIVSPLGGRRKRVGMEFTCGTNYCNGNGVAVQAKIRLDAPHSVGHLRLSLPSPFSPLASKINRTRAPTRSCAHAGPSCCETSKLTTNTPRSKHSTTFQSNRSHV